jgi:hypothetical protein
MENLVAVTVAAAGLAFSISLALLIEELLFGAIFRLLFGRMNVTTPPSARAALVGDPGARPARK